MVDSVTGDEGDFGTRGVGRGSERREGEDNERRGRESPGLKETRRGRR